MSNIRSLFVIMLCGVYASCTAMVVDNRFFPLFPKPYTRTKERPSQFSAEVFFMAADSSYGDREESIGWPEIFGRYDQTNESQGMVDLGLPSPLLDEWRGFDIKWRMDGKLQAQGIALYYDQAITEQFSFGGTWLFMKSNSWHNFFFDNNNSTGRFTDADRLELDQERRQMNQILGLCGPEAKQSGSGDIELYIRYGYLSEYCYKFRRMDVGLKVGALIPTGVKRNIFSPASVPFGGDGFWGFYVQGEGEFELKEDLIAGIMIRASKRIAKTRLERCIVVLNNGNMQIVDNSLLYGVLAAPIFVDPGATIMASPYVALDHVRAGLGGRLRYTLVVHEPDDWRDRRPENLRPVAIPESLGNERPLDEKLRWAYDYVSLTAYYDFNSFTCDEGLAARVYLTWDFPVQLFKAYNMSKTNKISLGVEVHF